jgi:alpha-L-fucosidase 2
VRGLRARGGFEIDIAWEVGKLQQATIRSQRGGTCRVRTSTPVIVMAGAAMIQVAQPEPEVVTFECTAGERYELMPSTM